MNFSDWLFKPRATKRFTRSGISSQLRLEALEDRLAPASTISIGDVSVALGAGSAGFTLTRTGDTSAAIQVDYTTTNGTATAGVNYTPTSGAVTFASGQTTATLSVPLPITNFVGSSLSFSVELTGITILNSVPASFTSQTASTGNDPYGVTVIDVNGDGQLGLVVANASDGTVSVLMNTTAPGATTPTFAAAQTFATDPNTNGTNPQSVKVADINGDGKPDIIVANEATNTVSVLLNTTATGAATPTFAPAVTFATGSQPFSVAVADLNGDGKPDLVVANKGGAGTVSVLLNTTATGAATPTFATQQTFNTGNGPQGVKLADLTGDGVPDIIVTNGSDADVSVLTNLDVTNLGGPGTATIANSAAEVQLLTTTTGDLYRIDSTGAHFIVGGIAGASATYEPSGEVILVTTMTGDLYRIDSTGIHFVVGGIVASASITYEPSGEVVLVTTTAGDLYRLDSTGGHFIVGGIASASATYEPSGEVLLVTTKTGDLYRIDSTGGHLIGGGIIAGASVSYGPSGEVVLVTATGGDLYQLDATGAHLVFGGIIESANVAYEP